jgi:hypothetical protein
MQTEVKLENELYEDTPNPDATSHNRLPASGPNKLHQNHTLHKAWYQRDRNGKQFAYTIRLKRGKK